MVGVSFDLYSRQVFYCAEKTPFLVEAYFALFIEKAFSATALPSCRAF